MPYHFEKKGVILPEDKDRRRKLSEADKEEIRELYKAGGHSWRSLAKQYGVSKSTINFVLNPERRVHNVELRNQRGGSKIYYDKDSHRESIQDLRQHKKKIFGLKQEGDENREADGKFKKGHKLNDEVILGADLEPKKTKE